MVGSHLSLAYIMTEKTQNDSGSDARGRGRAPRHTRLGHRFGLAARAVVGRDQINAAHLEPGGNLEVGPEAGAENGEF